jgi:hypothetical protein
MRLNLITPGDKYTYETLHYAVFFSVLSRALPKGPATFNMRSSFSAWHQCMKVPNQLEYLTLQFSHIHPLPVSSFCLRFAELTSGCRTRRFLFHPPSITAVSFLSFQDSFNTILPSSFVSDKQPLSKMFRYPGYVFLYICLPHSSYKFGPS